MEISEASMIAAIDRMRAAGGFTFESTGRTSKAYVWRDGAIFLEVGVLVRVGAVDDDLGRRLPMDGGYRGIIPHTI